MQEDERSFNISLTDSGFLLKEEALRISEILDRCINLSYNELVTLRNLLNKALESTRNTGNTNDKSNDY
ncbi:MAG: hypothetical protein IJ545_01270 [Alphaproteobacteria bacterium]|nr:hypothetical protein [Alphaproteobacteria bacterium]